MALYGSSANLGPDTTAYTTTGEITGTGYTAGGVALTSVVVGLTGGVTYLDAANIEWPVATFIARAGLLYNASKANRALAVLDFGAEKASLGNTFRVVLPPPNSEKAFMRLTTYRG